MEYLWHEDMWKKAIPSGSVQSEVLPLELVPDPAARAPFAGLGYAEHGWSWQRGKILRERCMVLRASVKAAVEE